MPSSDLASAAPPAEETFNVDSARTLSAALTAELDDFCDRVEDGMGRATAAVIRLRGNTAPENWPGDIGIDAVTRWEKALRRLERSEVATIAVAEGVCAGPALEVLLTADYRIAAPGLRLELPVTGGSVWAGMGVHRLVNQLGAARARQLVLFGAELSADRALAIGLLDEIAEDPALAAARLTERLALLAPGELAIRRRLVLDAGVTAFEESLGMHLAACDRTLRRRAEERAGAVVPH